VMRVESARDVVGLWVFDEHGRVLGEVVGIVHHWDGRTSALLDGGGYHSGTGRLISLEGAVVVDHRVYLRGPSATLVGYDAGPAPRTPCHARGSVATIKR
jgi:PRC-barrel domain protein